MSGPHESQIIPIKNIPVIRTESEGGSHYAPFRILAEGEMPPAGTEVVTVPTTGDRLAVESSIQLMSQSMEIEGVSFDGLYEYKVGHIDLEEIADGIKRLGQKYETENQGKKFGLITEEDRNGKKMQAFYFDEDFRQWVIEKEAAEGDPRFRPFLRSFIGSNVGENYSSSRNELIKSFDPQKNSETKHWPDNVGRFDKNSLIHIAQNLKKSNDTFLNEPDVDKNIRQRVKVHEMAHFLSNEILLGDTLRRIDVPLLELSEGKAKAHAEAFKRFTDIANYNERSAKVITEWDIDPEIVQKVKNVEFLYNSLKGLGEAYSMIHELAGNLNVDANTPKILDLLKIRSTILLSKYKYEPNVRGEKPDIAKTVVGNESTQYECHDLGAAIILTNGDFLALDKRDVVFGQPESGTIDNDAVIGQIQSLSENSESFAQKLDFPKLKKMVEVKLFDAIVLLTSAMANLKQYVEAKRIVEDEENSLREIVRTLDLSAFVQIKDQLLTKSQVIESARSSMLAKTAKV